MDYFPEQVPVHLINLMMLSLHQNKAVWKILFTSIIHLIPSIVISHIDSVYHNIDLPVPDPHHNKPHRIGNITTFSNPTNSSIYLRLIHSLIPSIWKNPDEVKLVPLSNPSTFYFVSSFKSPSFHRILFSLAQTLRRVGRS
jgi:hypothetical protein